MILPTSSLFGVLSLISLLVMAFILWGVIRACRRHNHSLMGHLCDKEAHLPNDGMIVASVSYILLTVGYILLPLFFQHFLL